MEDKYIKYKTKYLELKNNNNLSGGDVYLCTPVFYFKKEDIINDKTFTIKDLDLINHWHLLYEKIKNYKKIFIISHSRGWILSKFFISLYLKSFGKFTHFVFNYFFV